MPRRWLQGSAQGFNPGNPQNNEFALKLKGREADLIKLAPIAAQNLECAIETCYNWTYFRVVSTFDLPPLQLQGESLWWRFPGSKPWVESSSPFAARPFGPKDAKQNTGWKPMLH
jgi:hypothetical protein